MIYSRNYGYLEKNAIADWVDDEYDLEMHEMEMEEDDFSNKRLEEYKDSDYYDNLNPYLEENEGYYYYLFNHEDDDYDWNLDPIIYPSE